MDGGRRGSAWGAGACGGGTVGEFLSGGRGPGAPVRTAGTLVVCLSLSVGVLAMTLRRSGGFVESVLLAVRAPFGADSVAGALWASVPALAVLGVVLLVISSLHEREGADCRRRQVLGRAVSAMLSNPRFGVERATPMGELGLRVKMAHRGQVAVCRCRFGFQPEDFRERSASSSPSAARSLFGAYDYEVIDGVLYVYFDAGAAEEVREKRYRKGWS